MYDITFAREVVSNWEKSCTRAEQLDSLYEDVCDAMGTQYRLGAARSLRDDLTGLMANSMDNPEYQVLWSRIKRGAKQWQASPIPPDTLLQALRSLRVASMRAYRKWQQLELFGFESSK
jgi:hypothetical protein